MTQPKGHLTLRSSTVLFTLLFSFFCHVHVVEMNRYRLIWRYWRPFCHIQNPIFYAKWFALLWLLTSSLCDTSKSPIAAESRVWFFISRARHGAQRCGVTDRPRETGEQLESQLLPSPAAGNLQRNLQLVTSPCIWSGGCILSGFNCLMQHHTTNNTSTAEPGVSRDEREAI